MPKIYFNTAFAWGVMAVLSMISLGKIETAMAMPNKQDKPVIHLPAFPLHDEDGKNVIESGKPYSTEKSCSGSSCHDYTKITHAYHFEQGREQTDDNYGKKRGDILQGIGFKGVSSLVGPGYFGGYNCVQGNATGYLARKDNPDRINFGEWGAAQFLQSCNSCHVGGGWEEKDRNGNRYDKMPMDKVATLDGDYYVRSAAAKTTGGGTPVVTQGDIVVKPWDWKASGVREADCLTCHADFSALKKFPASNLGTDKDGSSDAYTHWGYLQSKFVSGGFFRYMNSAMLEFMNIRTDLPEGLQLLTVDKTAATGTAPNPNYTLTLTNGQPKLNWNRAAFDKDGNVMMPMYNYPGNDNCMMCHLASGGVNRITSGKGNGSRRGFYGFGPESQQTLNNDGTRVDDYKDDVHKGKTWIHDNGEVRDIESCNACHSKDYYRKAGEAVPLSPDHQFPRGAGDSDVRHDLSNGPEPLECVFCHDTAKKPALPTTKAATAQDAHIKLWTDRGYMKGYQTKDYTKTVKVHLDTIACQDCHINKVAYSNVPNGLIQHRNKIDFDGVLRTVPYKPYFRYYAQDMQSGRIISRYETGIAGGASADPTTYQGWLDLKKKYDDLLITKGYSQPDVRFVYASTNDYYLNHQTRPAVEAVACGECHNKREDGSFDAAVSRTGLYGQDKKNILTSKPLPEGKKLVEQGIIVLAKPYWHVDDQGNIYANAAEELEYSKTNPSMSLFNLETIREINGGLKVAGNADIAKFSHLSDLSVTKLNSKLANPTEMFVFNSDVGHESLRRLALYIPKAEVTNSLEIEANLKVSSRTASASEITNIKKLGYKKQIFDVYTISVENSKREIVNNFGKTGVVIKIPYEGSYTKADKIGIFYSDTGSKWTKLATKYIVDFAPPSTSGGSYILVSIPTELYVKIAPNLVLAEKI